MKNKGLDEILAMLREQIKNPELKDIVFIYWDHRPLTHAKWMRMLAEAGFHVIECRTLAEIKNIVIKAKVEGILGGGFKPEAKLPANDGCL